MIHQTPIPPHSNILKMIKREAAQLRKAVKACGIAHKHYSCLIQLNECEKLLALVAWHREQYELYNKANEIAVDAEVIEAHDQAERFGMP